MYRSLLLFTLLLLPTGCRTPAGPFHLLGTTRSLEMAPLKAGVATVAFTPEPGYPLAGYGGGARRDDFPFYFGGGWPGRLSIDLHQWWNGNDPDERADMLEGARGAHEELTARALVLETGGVPVALVRLDLVVGSGRLHDAVAEQLAPLGFAPETVILAATHTHSSVGGYLQSRFAKLAGMDNYKHEIFEALVGACVQAIKRAYHKRQPVELRVAQALDADEDGRPRVAENRRRHDFPDDVHPDDVDPRIELLEVGPTDGGAALAVLVNYAVHPTVLSPENLYFSADLAGGIERALSARLQGTPPVLFFNGAEGDIGPRGGYGGLTRCNELGEALADVAAPALGQPLTRVRQGTIQAAWGERDLGDPFIYFAAGSRQAFLEADDSWPALLAMAPFTLPLNLFLWLLGFENARVALNYNATVGVRFDLSAYGPIRPFRYHAIRLQLESGEDLVVVTVPGEALHTVGERVKAEARRRGAEHVLFVGLANGALSYIADEEEYYRGGYEAMATIFGPETAALSEEALGECLDAVGLMAPE